MLFNSKPLVYLQLQDRSIRYLSLHAKSHEMIDKGEIIFENPIFEEGHLTSESLLIARLEALVKEKNWKNASAHILLLNDFIAIRNETVPSQLSKEEVRAYLELHINQSIRLPIDNPKFDFEIIQKNETEQDIYIIAYPGDVIEKYQAILQKASLKPVVADLSALSLYRIADYKGAINKQENYHTLLLEWNPYDISLMAFTNNRPTFNRHSQTPRLADLWELTQEDGWVWNDTDIELEHMLEDQLNGLERFLDFYRYSVLNGQGSINEIILTGDYPDLVQLKEKLTERFGLKVSMLELPDGLDSEFSALYGLTLKEHKGGRRA